MKRTRFERLRAWWRVIHGFCPECNSSGPHMDDCQTCKGWWSGSTGNTFPPSPEIKAEWTRRYYQARCTHGKPMEDQCPECNTWLKAHLNAEKGNPRRG